MTKEEIREWWLKTFERVDPETLVVDYIKKVVEEQKGVKGK